MEATNDIRSVLLNEWYRLKDTTIEDVSIWDAFISLVKDKVPVYLITLKADIQVLEYIAGGLSINAIFQKTGIPSKLVRKTAFTWGLIPLEQALDFNPLLVYNSSMTPRMLELRMNDILAEPLDLAICEAVINNIERYLDLQEILRKEDI
jgi:hypothetical protein